MAKHLNYICKLTEIYSVVKDNTLLIVLTIIKRDTPKIMYGII